MIQPVKYVDVGKANRMQKDGSEAKMYAVEEAQQISLYHFYTCRCVIFFYFKKNKKNLLIYIH
jgi:hypothetical protein